MNGLIEIQSDLYFLDVRKLGSGNVSGVYLLLDDGITLIETGTSLVGPYILQAVDVLGFEPAQIKRAIVTHIHLDHSGGTGWLAERLPEMSVHVHERGLKHLEDPAALIESAKTVYGDLAAILRIHGEILPVPVERMHAVTEGKVDIGSRELELFHAPGHASHHLCVFDPASGSLFSGEALGHHHPESGAVRPAVAPPGFSLEDSLETFRRIEAIDPKRICFSQYGHSMEASAIIRDSRRQLETCHERLLPLFQAGRSTGEVIAELEASLAADPGDGTGLFGSMLVSIVSGFEIYFKRRGLI